ncbi:S-adenosylmethionine-dependent methyltransferase [Penicillium taxi]|uniref:S-adenosylmethionine-dependent methyltransferase n=1 Tax=Penicillium taxi TaxID=168475 RepID=UPI002545BB67|nr:S-adenosylmethionine-dependent methyltransferase [Penicillium taxi]KAJ5888412.1 S-adenosylmethionine-dependent methyltransferase [Penicillium taxi]
MADENTPTYLSPSELGTKEYWETYYARTRAHISSTHDEPRESAQATQDSDTDADADADSDVNDEDDPGTSWFSEHNAPEKVLRFLTRRSFPLAPRNTKQHQVQPSILDLGTGNGSMLALLQKKGGFRGDLVGVDYSLHSVELARELQVSRGHSAYRTDSEDEDESESEDESDAYSEKGDEGRLEVEHTATASTPSTIQFEEWDILNSKAALSPSGTSLTPPSTAETLSWFPYSAGGFDIVLDKGTFDAISLADGAKETAVCERYPDIARRLVRRGGFMVVTSCNWTEDELIKWFTGASPGKDTGDRFTVWGCVEYPRFRFGGQEGQGFALCVFRGGPLRMVDLHMHGFWGFLLTSGLDVGVYLGRCFQSFILPLFYNIPRLIA